MAIYSDEGSDSLIPVLLFLSLMESQNFSYENNKDGHASTAEEIAPQFLVKTDPLFSTGIG